MADCYMMSRERAEAVATALRQLHPQLGHTIDERLVRIYCTGERPERAPVSPTWLDEAPAAAVAAWIDIDRLLGKATTT